MGRFRTALDILGTSRKCSPPKLRIILKYSTILLDIGGIILEPLNCIVTADFRNIYKNVPRILIEDS